MECDPFLSDLACGRICRSRFATLMALAAKHLPAFHCPQFYSAVGDRTGRVVKDAELGAGIIPDNRLCLG